MLTADRVIFTKKKILLKPLETFCLLLQTETELPQTKWSMTEILNEELPVEKWCLLMRKQTISTDVLYYDRVKNTAYFNSGEPLMMEEIPCGLSLLLISLILKPMNLPIITLLTMPNIE